MSLATSPAPYPAALSIAPFLEHTSTFIFLHGKGGNGKEIAIDFLSLDFTPFLSDKSSYLPTTCKYTGKTITSIQSLLPHTRFVFPTSSKRYDSRFQDTYPQWFEIWSLENMQEQEELQLLGLKQSVMYLQVMVEKEVEQLGGDSSKVILAGLSQGCAIGALTALTGKQRLGGFVGLSGWIPLAKRIETWLNEKEAGEDIDTKKLQEEVVNNILRDIKMPTNDAAIIQEATKVPIFIGHGEADNVIDISFGQELDTLVKGLGVEDVTYRTYQDLQHWYDEKELLDVVVWLMDRGFAIPPTSRDFTSKDDTPSKGLGIAEKKHIEL